MPDATPTLHLLCGKIASGKSTLAARLAEDNRAVLVAEDNWLQALYSDQMTTGADYVRCAARLRSVMGPHVAALLTAGVSVVLDFPANTVETRRWMRDILDATGAAHRMHLLTADDDLCLARLKARNAAGTHAFAATEALFRRFSSHFVPPTEAEGFTIVIHDPGT